MSLRAWAFFLFATGFFAGCTSGLLLSDFLFFPPGQPAQIKPL